MGIVNTLMSQQFITQIGWVLVHFLWQACIVWTLTWGLMKILAKASANTRYIAACLGLLLMAVTPAVTFFVMNSSGSMNTPVSVISQYDNTSKPQTTEDLAWKVITSDHPLATSEKSIANNFNGSIESALPYCVMGWALGVASLSFWYLGGWCRLQKLRCLGTETVSHKIKENTLELAEQLGIRQVVHIAQSLLVQTPTVIGWLKPIILLPASALTGLTEQQLTALIAHELAHIKRHDYFVNIMQTVIEILGFYHPAVWWISRQIRMERENCCDDMAIALVQDRKVYAKALFSMEQMRSLQLKLAVAASGGLLEKRIERLIEKQSSIHEKPGWIPIALVSGLLAVLIISVAVTAQTTGQSPERILHFPTEYCLGKILIQDDTLQRSIETYHHWIDKAPWEPLGPAMGDVHIPAGKRVELMLYSTAWEKPEKLAPLKNLKPDDIDSLVISTGWTEHAQAPFTDKCIPYIQHLTGLNVLDLSGAAVTQQGLKLLSNMNRLKRIGVPNNLTNGGLGAIVKMQSLNAIYFRRLCRHRLTDQGISLLKQLPRLEELELVGEGLTVEGLSHLSGLNSLQYLWLNGGRFSPEGFEYIAAIPNLKIAKIYTENCGDEGVQKLAQNTKLERLNLHWLNDITDQGIYYISQMPGLKMLDVGSANLTDRALEYLEDMTILEQLDLPSVRYIQRNQPPVDAFSDEGIAHLSALKSLKYLHVSSSSRSPLTDLSLSAISKIPSLEELTIGGTGFTDAGMKELSRLKNLKKLTFGAAPEVSDEGFSQLSLLNNLESFDWMGNSKVTFAGLNRFNGHKKLKRLGFIQIQRGTATLNLSGMESLEDLRLSLPRIYDKKNGTSTFAESFTDADISCLTGLKKLNYLHLSGNGIGDTGLEYLSQLDNLGTLFLYGQSRITDNGLKYLSGLDQLRQLHIKDGHFTDNTLETLAKLDGLEMLELTSDTAFSKPAITKFREKKKNILILKLDANTNQQSVRNGAYGGGMIGGIAAGSKDAKDQESLQFPRNRDEIANQREGAIPIDISAEENAADQSYGTSYRNQVYDISNLLNRTNDPNLAAGNNELNKQANLLMDEIRKEVVPSSWSENGGNGNIQLFGHSQLIIWQTSQVHEKTQQYLEQKNIALQKELGIQEWAGTKVSKQESIQFPKNWDALVKKHGDKCTFEYIITTATDGRPIEGVSVQVRNVNTAEWYRTESNKEGIARFELPPNEYQLKIIYKKGYLEQRPDSVFQVTADSARTVIKLKDCPAVSGVVRDTDGNPVSNARVIIAPEGTNEQVTDSAGHFTAKWDPRTGNNKPEVVYVMAIHEKRNLAGTVQIFENTRDVDIKLTPATTVRGRVVDIDGKPIPQAKIRIMLHAGHRGETIDRLTQMTDNTGGYEIKGIPVNHEYSLYAEADGYGRDISEFQTNQAEKTLIELVPVVLKKANLSLTGVVVDHLGKPVSHAEINPYGEGQAIRQEILSDEEGKFRIDHLCEGPVYIQVFKDAKIPLRTQRDVKTQAGVTDVKIVVTPNGKSISELGGGMGGLKVAEPNEPIKYSSVETQSALEVLNIELEPVAQGKNILYATVKNTSDTAQLLAIHIYTRSVDYGPDGIGWGTPFFEKLQPNETKRARFVYQIQGPVTENMYVRVKFYNPATEKSYDYKKPFAERFYKGSDLQKQEPPKALKPAPDTQFKEVSATLKIVQDYIANKNYEKAWDVFAKDYKKAGYQARGFEAFKRQMEPEHRLDSAFTWEKSDFLKLAPVQAYDNNGTVQLQASCDGAVWSVDFTKENDVWKINWIAGYRPAILDIPQADEAKQNASTESLSDPNLPNQMQMTLYDVNSLLVPSSMFNPVQIPETMLKVFKQEIETIVPSSWEKNGGSGHIETHGDSKLLIRQTPEMHNNIKRYLEYMQEQVFYPLKYEKYQIAIEARFILTNDDYLKDVGVDASKHVIGQVIEGPANSAQIQAALEPKTLAERKLPFDNFDVLDDPRVSFLVQAAQRYQSVKQLTAPKAMVLNAEPATLQVKTTQSYQDTDDKEKTVEKGIILDLKPTIQNDSNDILLEGHVLISDILSNQTQESNGKSYEIPVLEISSIPIHTMVINRQTILVTGPKLSSSINLNEKTAENPAQSISTDRRQLIILIKLTIVPVTTELQAATLQAIP
jgi:beta-lactamase regulating signal transducer with metallopeptidase domain/protocatechuate 3,4-dioxygenase beta subunit